MRFVDDEELATSAYERSETSKLAAPLKTDMLVSDGFRVTADESGGEAMTAWNVLTWLPTGLGCCPVSVGAVMFSVRRSMVLGLSGWSVKRTWLPDIWRNRGLSGRGPTTTPSLCRIWLRSISSRVDAFWCPEISWIPVTGGLIQPRQWQHINTRLHTRENVLQQKLLLKYWFHFDAKYAWKYAGFVIMCAKICTIYRVAEKNLPNFRMALCNKSAEKLVCNEQTSSNMSFYMYINEFSPKMLPY